MRSSRDEADRWTWEWAREGRGAIRSLDLEDSWAEATELDLAQIEPELALSTWERQVVLDLGCGPGRLALALARRYRHAWVHGVDICEAVVGAARVEKHSHLATSGRTNAFFHVGDGRRLPPAIPDRGIDAAYSMLVFQHLEPEAVQGYLHELRRVLRPGGRFRFQFCIGTNRSLYAQDHDPGEMRQWCRSAGLNVLSEAPDGRYETWWWMTAERRK